MNTSSEIQRGLELVRQRREIDRELGAIRQRLEPLFPAKCQHEVMKSEAGEAVRTVRREWWIAPGKLDAVRAILGTAYAHMIDREMPLTVTAQLRSLLHNDTSDIALQLRPYIIINRTVRVDFREPTSDLAVSDDGTGSIVMMLQETLEEKGGAR